MTEFKKSIEIGGKNYDFIANRNAKVLQEGVYSKVLAKTATDESITTEQMKITFVYGLLQGALSMQDCKTLYEIAISEKEYGDAFDNFIAKMQNHTVTVGKKTLDFLDEM